MIGSTSRGAHVCQWYVKSGGGVRASTSVETIVEENEGVSQGMKHG